MISNCLLFAFERWRARGGYVVVMHSVHGWWPHFTWSPDLIHFEEFSPAVKHARLLPPLLFRGCIQRWEVLDGPEPRPLIYVEPMPGNYESDRRVFERRSTRRRKPIVADRLAASTLL